MRRIRSTKFAGRMARNYAERNMTAQVRIGRPGAVVDGVDVSHPSTVLQRKVVYLGKARVYGVGSGGSSNVGDELTFWSSSYVSIPLSATWTQVDDMIEVVAHEDADVVGRWFRVVNVDSGGQLPVVRRHTVSGVQRDPGWTWAVDP